WRKSVSAKFTPIAWVLSSTMPGRTSGLGPSASASTSGPPVSLNTIAFIRASLSRRAELPAVGSQPSRPPSADQGVDGFVKRAAVLDGPARAFCPLDLKPANLARDVLGREENVRLRGPAPALGEVQEVVAHHEQGPARSHRVRRVPERSPALGGRELHVEHADQIIGLLRR